MTYSIYLALALATAGEGEAALEIAHGIPPGADDEASANAALALATVEMNKGNGAGIRAHAPRAIELAQRSGALDVEVQAVDALAWADFWMAPDQADYRQAQVNWERASDLARHWDLKQLADRLEQLAK